MLHGTTRPEGPPVLVASMVVQFVQFSVSSLVKLLFVVLLSMI